MRSRQLFLWPFTLLRRLLTRERKSTTASAITAVNIGIGYWDGL
jgi:hypothetical protein